MEQIYRIGIDHGYGNIKTAHHIFESGIIERERAFCIKEWEIYLKDTMEIKEKQVKGKSITVTYTDGTIDKGPLKTEKYIKGVFGEKVNTIHYACVADTLLSLRREVYSASYEAVNERSLSAAVREIHRKRECALPVKPPGILRGVMEDLELLLSIRQIRYLHGLPYEERTPRQYLHFVPTKCVSCGVP